MTSLVYVQIIIVTAKRYNSYLGIIYAHITVSLYPFTGDVALMQHYMTSKRDSLHRQSGDK